MNLPGVTGSLCLLVALSFSLNAEELTNDSSQEKEKVGQILGGWGDRLFSIFGDAIENQRKERRDLLDKLAGEDGELTNQEIKEFLENEAELNAKEEERALNQLGKMYDPEGGLYSGLYKLSKKIENKRFKQATQLDQKIESVISEIDSIETKKTVLKLRTIHWIPIGSPDIDKEMSEHYANLIAKIIEEMKSD